MLQLFLIAIRNLGSHRRRTLLLGGAIAGVTALLVVMMGLSFGSEGESSSTRWMGLSFTPSSAGGLAGPR